MISIKYMTAIKRGSAIKQVCIGLLLAISASGGSLVANADDKTAIRPSFVQGSVDAQVFIERASTAGIAEVELAKMAMAKSTMDEVRHFAQMMIEDHTAVNKELRKLADAKGLKIADEPTLVKRAKAYVLEMQKGESFDTAYAKNQLEAHTETLKLFRQAANSSDPDVKTLADAFVPTLEHHYSMAEALVDAVAKAAPQTPAQ